MMALDFFLLFFVDHVQFLQMNHAWGDDQALRSQIGRTNSNVMLSLNLGTILIVFGILMLLFKQKKVYVLKIRLTKFKPKSVLSIVPS